MNLEARAESTNPLMIVISNCTPGEAPQLAEALVSEGLAACVNVIGPVQSYYIWQGEFTADTESTLLIKTTQDRTEALTERLRELHSYSVPEIVVLAPEAALRAYAQWARDSTGGGE